MNKKSTYIIIAVVVILLLLLLAWYFWWRKKDGDSCQPKGKVPKIDTRLDLRWEYHIAIYDALRGKGLGHIGAIIGTAHASKAQRGWKEPNPGKLWNYNCFGIKANPTWQAEKSFFVAPGSEYNVDRGYYPVVASWRSYCSVQESVDDFVSLLKGKYPASWRTLQTATSLEYPGTCHAFAVQLKLEGPYFTADLDGWAQSINNIANNIVEGDVARRDA